MIKVCDRECDKAEAGGGRREAGGGRREARAGYRIKSKNPTQRCGEQLFKLERDPSSLQFSKLSHFNPKLNRLHLYIYIENCEKLVKNVRHISGSKSEDFRGLSHLGLKSEDFNRLK